MSVLTVIVSIRDGDQLLPGLPITRRIEDTTGEVKIIDTVFDTVSAQEFFGLASSVSPIGALWFEDAALIEIVTPILNTTPFDSGPNAAIVIMENTGIGFTPLIQSRVRGIA